MIVKKDTHNNKNTMGRAAYALVISKVSRTKDYFMQHQRQTYKICAINEPVSNVGYTDKCMHSVYTARRHNTE